MKKITLFAVILGILFLSACGSTNAPRSTIPSTSAPSTVVSANTDPIPTAQSSNAPTKTFTMVAKQFAFEPSTITVNKGDHVVITLTTPDVRHGFALPDFGVSTDINPGTSSTVEFTADKVGTFEFRCNIPCGPGHRDMTGTLVVQ